MNRTISTQSKLFGQSMHGLYRKRIALSNPEMYKILDKSKQTGSEVELDTYTVHLNLRRVIS